MRKFFLAVLENGDDLAGRLCSRDRDNLLGQETPTRRLGKETPL